MERRRFALHFVEMLAAMVAGMVVFGGLVSAFCAVAGHRNLLQHPGTSAPIMATNMTLGMVVWMRYRGHGWRPITEMAGAMYAPLALLALPYALGVLGGGALLAGTHGLMVPAMFLAMLYRRDEYVHEHRAPVAYFRTEQEV